MAEPRTLRIVVSIMTTMKMAKLRALNMMTVKKAMVRMMVSVSPRRESPYNHHLI